MAKEAKINPKTGQPYPEPIKTNWFKKIKDNLYLREYTTVIDNKQITVNVWAKIVNNSLVETHVVKDAV